MTKSKEVVNVKSHDIVLNCKDKDGKKLQISAQTFGMHEKEEYADFTIIDGVDYYVDKAKLYGAKMS